jgi:hypothetical protein
MATIQGSVGGIRTFDDFDAFDLDRTWAAGSFSIGAFAVTSVNEGTIENVVDETGGILQMTNDTADNDNFALYSGVYAPGDGEMAIETRLKVDNVSDLAIFVGFTETLAKDTPVMPAEFATATMTYNGTGGMVGLQFDSDGTTDDWRAVMGDGGAAVSGSGNGTAASDAAVADTWDILRVELHPDTSADCYVNGSLVKSFAGGGLTATDVFHAVVMVENRAASAAVTEIDYVLVTAGRDWRDD